MGLVWVFAVWFALWLRGPCSRTMPVMSCAKSGVRLDTYTALKSADEEALEDLAGLVAVADVLEGLGGVLAADVEEDFFTAGVLVYEAWRARGG